MWVVGERLNSSFSSVYQALTAGDRATVETWARRQLEAGCDALDCCASSLGSAEADVLQWLVEVVEVSTSATVVVDSPQQDTLVRVGQRRRRPVVLNSLGAHDEWPAELDSLLSGGGSEVVIQLRRAWNDVAKGFDERIEWTYVVKARTDDRGWDASRVWIDPVLLPGDADQDPDLDRFLSWMQQEWPEFRSLVGLSNASYGANDRSAVHCAWLTRLQAAGLHGVILDALDPALMAIARCG